MTWSILKRDVVKDFDRTTTLSTIEYNWDDLENNIKYLFPTIPLLIHNID